MLKEYEVVPPADWPRLAYRRHVRYVRADNGAFVRGGFVVGHVMKDGRPTITLSSSLGGNATVWPIGHDKIRTLYGKRTS